MKLMTPISKKKSFGLMFLIVKKRTTKKNFPLKRKKKVGARSGQTKKKKEAIGV